MTFEVVIFSVVEMGVSYVSFVCPSITLLQSSPSVACQIQSFGSSVRVGQRCNLSSVLHGLLENDELHP